MMPKGFILPRGGEFSLPAEWWTARGLGGHGSLREEFAVEGIDDGFDLLVRPVQEIANTLACGRAPGSKQHFNCGVAVDIDSNWEIRLDDDVCYGLAIFYDNVARVFHLQRRPQPMKVFLGWVRMVGKSHFAGGVRAGNGDDQSVLIDYVQFVNGPQNMVSSLVRLKVFDGLDCLVRSAGKASWDDCFKAG
jgi:hypothetical protein